MDLRSNLETWTNTQTSLTNIFSHKYHKRISLRFVLLSDAFLNLMDFFETDTIKNEGAFTFLNLQVIEIVTSGKGTEYALMKELGTHNYFSYDLDEFQNYFADNNEAETHPRRWDGVLMTLGFNPSGFKFYKKITGKRRKIFKISYLSLFYIKIYKRFKDQSLDLYDLFE